MSIVGRTETMSGRHIKTEGVIQTHGALVESPDTFNAAIGNDPGRGRVWPAFGLRES